MWPTGGLPSDRAGETNFRSCVTTTFHSTCKTMAKGGTKKKQKQPRAAEDEPENAIATTLQTKNVRETKKPSEWADTHFFCRIYTCVP